MALSFTPKVQTTQPAAPFGLPAPGTDLESHLGSSSNARSDTTQGDDFDFAPGSEGSTVVRGNADAPGILAEDIQGNTGVYVVKRGDTLSKIAKDHYGDANQYKKIFEANRKILSDPDKIQPGQVLTIPE